MNPAGIPRGRTRPAIAPIFSDRLPAWETVKDAKAAFACVRIAYDQRVIGFGFLGGIVCLVAVSHLTETKSLAAFFVVGAGVALLGLACASAIRRRQIIRQGRYRARDISAILADRIVGLLLALAFFAIGCVDSPVATIFLLPFAIVMVLYFVRDYRGWRRCLGYLDKIEEQPDTAAHVE